MTCATNPELRCRDCQYYDCLTGGCFLIDYYQKNDKEENKDRDEN